MNGLKAWEFEYLGRGAIPSSLRQSPARAVRQLADHYGLGREHHVLDVGCGNGRNTVFLAERGCSLIAIDFSPTAIALCRRRVQAEGLLHRVTVMEWDINGTLWPSASLVDVCLDSYVMCHFVNTASRDRLIALFRDAIQPNGLVLSVVLGDEDEYYTRVGVEKEPSVVTDPANGITKRLYDCKGLADCYESAGFVTDHLFDVRFQDVVMGTAYQRHIVAGAFRREIA